MNGDGVGFATQRNRDMATVTFVTIVDNIGLFEWIPANGCDPVIALIAIYGLVLKSELTKYFCWKTICLSLGLLQADHIWIVFLNEFLDQIGAQTHRVDIPTNNSHYAISLKVLTGDNAK